jgi:hypothetical protein
MALRPGPATPKGPLMNPDELMTKMRGRIEMCRRLAQSTTDKQAADVLRQMADDGERDLRQLEAENAAKIDIVLTPEQPKSE